MSFMMRVLGRGPKSSRTPGRNGLPMQTRTMVTSKPVKTVARPTGQAPSAQPPSAQLHHGGGVPVQTLRPQAARPTKNIPAPHTQVQNQHNPVQNQHNPVQNQHTHVQTQVPTQAPTTGRPQGVLHSGLPKYPGFLGSMAPKASGSAGSKHAGPPRETVARKPPAFGFSGLPNNFTGTVYLQPNGRWDIRPDGDRRLSGVPPEAKDAVVEAMGGFTQANLMRGVRIQVIYRFDGSIDVQTIHVPQGDVANSAPAALPHRI